MDEGTPDKAAKRARGREYERKYREAHREEVNERGRQWKLENPEQLSEQRRRYREVNQDKIKAWVEANRGQRAAYMREYHASNRERLLARKREASREYRQRTRLDPDLAQRRRDSQRRHREANRQHIRSRERLRKHGLTPEGWTALWTAQDGKCYLCLCPLSADNAVIEHDHRCCPEHASCSTCRRGLACAGCNNAVGFAGDDPERMLLMAGNLRKAMQAVAERMLAKPVQGSLFGENDAATLA
jgi:hypothetical protein